MRLIIVFLVAIIGLLFTDGITSMFRTNEGVALFLCGMVTTLACLAAYDLAGDKV